MSLFLEWYIFDRITPDSDQTLLEMIIDKNNILFWETNKKTPGEYPIVIVASDGVDEIIQEYQLLVEQ